MSFNKSSAHGQSRNLLQWTARWGTPQVQECMWPVSNSPRSFTRAGCACVRGLCFCLVGRSLVYSPDTTQPGPNLDSWSIQHQRKLVEVSKMQPQKSKFCIRPGTDFHKSTAERYTAFHQHSAFACSSSTDTRYLYRYMSSLHLRAISQNGISGRYDVAVCTSSFESL